MTRKTLMCGIGLLALIGGLALQAEAQYFCGCMDVVLVIDDTGSMGPAIDNVKAGLGDIVTAADTASGGDLQMGLVSFKDIVDVDQPLTMTITDVETAINALFAFGGAGGPEASDEALNYVVNGASACTVEEPFGPLGSFRGDCVKIAVMVTDNLPGGCDDIYTPGVDDVNAAAVADAAAAAGILISAVFVGTPTATELGIMQYYAAATGGVYSEVPFDGSGTGAAGDHRELRHAGHPVRLGPQVLQPAERVQLQPRDRRGAGGSLRLARARRDDDRPVHRSARAGERSLYGNPVG
jgi:hypothetical protein